MTDESGAFYSAEDADSEEIEGKFYVWSPKEVKVLLGEELGALYCEAYDITEEGNFEGASIPNQIHGDEATIAANHGMKQTQLMEQLEVARRKLFAAREQRIHPHKDDKILTSWNGLMVTALAKAARVLERRNMKRQQALP